MIYTVTLNPSLDYHMSLKKLIPGEVNRTEQGTRVLPGGKGINVSMMLKNLSVESTALGFVAGFAGSELQRRLTERGISTDFIILKEGNTRINVKIHTGTDTDINAEGPVIGEAYTKALLEKLHMLRDGDFLVLSGTLPPSFPETFYGDIMKSLRTAGKEIKVIVDSTKTALTNALKYHPFLVKPNIHELREIFEEKSGQRKNEYTDLEAAKKYGRKLQEMGAVNVLISMGKEGAVFIGREGQCYRECAVEGKQINSVGAGDSMIAGFLAGFIKKGDYREAFEMALAAGSASAFSEDFASAGQVMACLKKKCFSVQNQDGIEE